MKNTTTFGQRLLNYATHPFKSWEIDKAKRDFRKVNPKCYVCGTERSNNGNRCDVHHITPVHANPSLACSYNNLITLCRRHHWEYGHLMTSWKVWDAKIFDTIKSVVKAKQETQKLTSLETYFDEQKGSQQT